MPRRDGYAIKEKPGFCCFAVLLFQVATIATLVKLLNEHNISCLPIHLDTLAKVGNIM